VTGYYTEYAGLETRMCFLEDEMSCRTGFWEVWERGQALAVRAIGAWGIDRGHVCNKISY
jgi:hypothetical protein